MNLYLIYHSLRVRIIPTALRVGSWRSPLEPCVVLVVLVVFAVMAVMVQVRKTRKPFSVAVE